MTVIVWLKALHVIFMVAWFAGIFYLPRLFVNHAETNSTEIAEHLKGMEKRLLYFITPFGV
jgi:putative membrane protein